MARGSYEPLISWSSAVLREVESRPKPDGLLPRRRNSSSAIGYSSDSCRDVSAVNPSRDSGAGTVESLARRGEAQSSLASLEVTTPYSPGGGPNQTDLLRSG